MTKIYRDRPEDITQVIQLLSKGKVVAVPTETVYGLAADTFNISAVRQVFNIKGRPFIDPLIVHTFDMEGVNRLASLNPSAIQLANVFWPGPLTLVLPKKPEVPSIVTANLNTVAIRIPMHPVLRKVLEDSKLCLAAPSANPFGYISPTTIEHVLDSLGDNLEYSLDGGACSVGMESTIIDITNPTKPILLRPGVIKIGKNEEFYVEDGTVEFSDNNLIVLSTSVQSLKKIKSDQISEMLKDAEKKVLSSQISDKQKYILNYKIET